MNPSCYRIRIRGHLGPGWSAWFDSLTVARADDGTTELVGPLIDQAALYGVLTRLRDLGATLLLVEHLTAEPGSINGRPGAPAPGRAPASAASGPAAGRTTSSATAPSGSVKT
jgi:hypothetical protein